MINYAVEVVMRRCVATFAFGVLLILNAGGSAALAEDAHFRFTNSTPETIYLNLYSETRQGWRWPDAKKRWVVNPGQKGPVAVGACQPNEKICFGGGNGNGSRYWGVSLDGKKGCSNCCIRCGGTSGWNLTEHNDPPPTNTIDPGPALVPSDE